MRFKVCTGITFKLVFQCILVTDTILQLTLLIQTLVSSKRFITMFLMTQITILYMSNMLSCFTRVICRVKGALQHKMLCGQMGVLANLKVHGCGTLYQDIPTSPHLVTTLEDVNRFGTFLPLGMGKGRWMEQGFY